MKEQRPIKFRRRHIDADGTTRYVSYWGFLEPCDFTPPAPFDPEQEAAVIDDQFTGMTDSTGKEIYEGDTIVYRYLDMEYQTHTGDNIPGGSYTEPMGAFVESIEQRVSFKDGAFCVGSQDEEDLPLCYMQFYHTDEEALFFFHSRDELETFVKDETEAESVEDLLENVLGVFTTEPNSSTN